jgi:hypothetical protein
MGKLRGWRQVNSGQRLTWFVGWLRIP